MFRLLDLRAHANVCYPGLPRHRTPTPTPPSLNGRFLAECLNQHWFRCEARERRSLVPVRYEKRRPVCDGARRPSFAEDADDRRSASHREHRDGHSRQIAGPVPRDHLDTSIASQPMATVSAFRSGSISSTRFRSRSQMIVPQCCPLRRASSSRPNVRGPPAARPRLRGSSAAACRR